MGNIFLLYANQLHTGGIQEQIQIASKLLGESMRIELGNTDGSYSQGLASLKSLKKAIRRDIKELLLEKYRYKAEVLPELLHIVRNPRYLFDFEKFKTLFATEIIPSQIVKGRDVIIFNLSRLSVFGNP